MLVVYAALILLPLLGLARRHVLAGRVGAIILSALVAHTGWHWMIDRGEVLWKVEWPKLDAPSLTVLARWVAGVLLAAGAVHVLRKRARSVLSRRAAARGPVEPV